MGEDAHSENENGLGENIVIGRFESKSLGGNSAIVMQNEGQNKNLPGTVEQKSKKSSAANANHKNSIFSSIGGASQTNKRTGSLNSLSITPIPADQSQILRNEGFHARSSFGNSVLSINGRD